MLVIPVISSKFSFIQLYYVLKEIHYYRKKGIYNFVIYVYKNEDELKKHQLTL